MDVLPQVGVLPRITLLILQASWSYISIQLCGILILQAIWPYMYISMQLIKSVW